MSLCVVVVVVVAVVVVVPITLALMWPERDARTAPASSSAAQRDWQTIEHEGVRVDVPSTWTRTDTSGCDFQVVRWGDPSVPSCEFRDGIAFYSSALFDPAHGPGVVRTVSDGDVTWSGYRISGDLVVYVFEHDDRDRVRAVLASVRR